MTSDAPTFNNKNYHLFDSIYIMSNVCYVKLRVEQLMIKHTSGSFVLYVKIKFGKKLND